MANETSTSAKIEINYIEFTVADMALTKQFYGDAFGWTFKDYGNDYVEFSDGRLTGGFTRGATVAGGPLVVLYAKDLAAVEHRVTAAGGKITTPPFAFPGGRRFHFADPSGNVLAVWSET